MTFLVILGGRRSSTCRWPRGDEVEPFKTFVLRLARPSAFVVYFVVITLLSVVVHRFFCRFLCPLGGGLAFPSRKPLLPLVRYDECVEVPDLLPGVRAQGDLEGDRAHRLPGVPPVLGLPERRRRTRALPGAAAGRRRSRPPTDAAALFLIGCLACRPSAPGGGQRPGSRTPAKALSAR